MVKNYKETDILDNQEAESQEKFNIPGYKKIIEKFSPSKKEDESKFKSDKDYQSPNTLGRSRSYGMSDSMEMEIDKANNESRNPLGRSKSYGMTASVEAKENIEPKLSGKLDKPALGDFKTAFKNARKEGSENFMYGGKKFSTATAEDVKSAGYNNLKDYLNSRFKKKVQNETPTDLS